MRTTWLTKISSALYTRPNYPADSNLPVSSVLGKASLLLLLAGLTVAAQDTSTLRLLVPADPYEPYELKINGKPRPLSADQTEIILPLSSAESRDKLTLELLYQPNNYTKIYRTKQVVPKPGAQVQVDFRVESVATDRIVVRWVPTPDDITDAMCKLAGVTKADVVYDPGSGDAVMLRRAVSVFGARKGIGIDIDPEMVDLSKELIEKENLTSKIVVRRGDILKQSDLFDLGEASVVLLYIGDDLNKRIAPLLRKNLKPGSRIVGHRFDFGEDWPPTRSVKLKGSDGDEYVLHLWIVPNTKPRG